MYRGEVPFLTKGDFALFLGGDRVLGKLEDRSPGQALVYVIIVSFIFQVSIFSLKKYKTNLLRSENSYAHSLRMALVNNVLNVYGLIVLFSSTCIILFYIWRFVLSISRDFLSS